jgi:hypothetical protein
MFSSGDESTGFLFKNLLMEYGHDEAPAETFNASVDRRMRRFKAAGYRILITIQKLWAELDSTH